MQKKTKVMIFGTFDIIHPGHKNFFKQAREFGDYLIVVVARDKTVKKVKSKTPINNEKKRLESIIKSKLADKAVLGDLKDKYKKIKEFKPDVICLGYDQKNFTEGLKNFDVKVIKLKPYKPEIYKTSLIKNYKIKN
jgi:FAD synthetase